MTRVLLPVAAIAFAAIGFAPMLRLRRKTGSWPITFGRNPDPVQKVVGVVVSCLFGALGIWVVLFTALGPEPLGVVDLPRATTFVGLASVAFGFATMVAAQRAMGASLRMGIDREPTALVTSGPFQLVRNPIYTGMGAILLGLVLLTPSPWTLGILAVAAVLLPIQTRLEEQHLGSLHGDRYRRYAAHVGRFLPSVGRLTDA